MITIIPKGLRVLTNRKEAHRNARYLVKYRSVVVTVA